MKPKAKAPPKRGATKPARPSSRQKPARPGKASQGGAAAPRKITARLKRVLAMFAQPELAKICGVTRQGVQQWTDLPAAHALAVEKASGGKLTKEFLAPGFYPRLGA